MKTERCSATACVFPRWRPIERGGCVRKRRQCTAPDDLNMSKLKTPQDKNRASLARDRRNAYGESPHGARKSIPRKKTISRQAARRAANQALAPLAADADTLDAMEHAARARGRLKHLRGFRKVRDVPLGEVIEFKQQRRMIQHGRKKRTQAWWAARSGCQPGTDAG